MTLTKIGTGLQMLVNPSNGKSHENPFNDPILQYAEGETNMKHMAHFCSFLYEPTSKAQPNLSYCGVGEN
jgi:hypothetical protein